VSAGVKRERFSATSPERKNLEIEGESRRPEGLLVMTIE
jgi:hypothetical protein